MLYAPVPGNHAAGSPDDENRGMQCRGAPHGTRWLLGMSNFTTTLQSMTANTFPLLLASKHVLVFLPSFQIAGSLPETKSPNRSSIPRLYCRNHSCLLAVFHFVRDMFQAYLWPRETTTFPCLMKWQNNRFAYVEAGAVTGLTTLDLKHVKWFISNSCP